MVLTISILSASFYRQSSVPSLLTMLWKKMTQPEVGWESSRRAIIPHFRLTNNFGVQPISSKKCYSKSEYFLEKFFFWIVFGVKRLYLRPFRVFTNKIRLVPCLAAPCVPFSARGPAAPVFVSLVMCDVMWSRDQADDNNMSDHRTDSFTPYHSLLLVHEIVIASI